MKKTKSLALAAFLASIIGCAAAVGPTSMRGIEISAPDRASPERVFTTKMPGVGQPSLIARSFPQQPPMVPHTVDQYVPLTMEENACLDCHITTELRGQPVPQMGDSHFSKTAKRRDGGPALSMDRFQCDTCHVAQVDAKPLVDNKFVGVK